eukprot:473598-Alexandrium_andersonii.AAC.1
MSASLVGSEMCIRDSSRPNRVKRPCRGLELGVKRGPGGFGVARWGRCAPVSYTHLTLPTICSV